MSPGLSHHQPSPEDQMLDPLLRHAENLDSYTELRSHANPHTRLVMRKGAIIETS